MEQHKRRRINVSLLIPFLVVAMVFGVMLWKKYRDSREVPVVPQVQPTLGKSTAVLFFVADGTRLAREARELEQCEDTTACLGEVMAELLSGPVGEFSEALPDGTVVNSVRIEENVATLDLNRNFVDALAPGSSAEVMAVYSLVDTVAANFPQLSKVRITVEGGQIPLLKHLDISEPLSPDYSLEQPPVIESDVAVHPKKTVKGKP